jgi:type II secretory pathway pseudopilin PulG
MAGQRFVAARRHTGPRGVSLIEALVALAIMSFGMLALVGVQATMRHNSDVARQRTEATRIATDDSESLRYFADLGTSATQIYLSWDQLVGLGPTAASPPGNTGNAAFTLTRTVTTVSDTLPNHNAFDGMAMKVVEVRVDWNDRTSSAHDAVLDSVVSGVAPALSARLMLPTPTTAPSRRGGRHVSIPVTAQDLGNGSSAFKPFNQGTTVWVLDHATGYATSVCTGVAAAQAAIMLADLSSCSTVLGRLVTGVVRYDLRTTTVDAAVAESPAGPVLPLDGTTPLQFYNDPASNTPVNQSTAPSCVADNPNSPLSAMTRTGIAYACLVFPTDATGWGGRLDLVAGSFPNGTPGNWQIGSAATDYRVCRYTTASTDYTANTDHPATYCRVNSSTCSEKVTRNLTNQNFLVILAVHSCPTDVAINPAAGDLVNSNTLPHQP